MSSNRLPWLPRWFARWLVLALACGAAAAQAQNAARAIADAEQAVESGADATAALDRLVAALAATKSNDAADELIDTIETLGDADGASPVAVKQHLRAQAPAALRRVIEGPFEWTVRGDAVMAHRALEASDEDLKAAIALAMADTSKEKGYINSRGELLQSWLDQRTPERRAELAAKPADAAAERGALARARDAGIGVSVDQLMSAAMDANREQVATLLDAGLDVNAKSNVFMSPLAASITACAKQVPEARQIATMDLLFERGADPDGTDALGNTILMSAVQQCGVGVARRLLDGGAKANPVNAQDFTPLEMALVMGKIDVAELLVERGARRPQDKLDRLFVETPEDPRLKALLAKAASK